MSKTEFDGVTDQVPKYDKDLVPVGQYAIGFTQFAIYLQVLGHGLISITLNRLFDHGPQLEWFSLLG